MRLSNNQFFSSQKTPPNTGGTSTNTGTSENMGRFYFNSLDIPVRANVMHQDAAGMTLRQELPFLELNGKLRDEHGREGSLENVSVCVRNGVPSLVLDVRYDDGRSDATVPFLMESTRAMRATTGLFEKASDVGESLPVPAPKKPRRDETLPYGIETVGGALAGADTVRVPTLPSVEELMRVTNPPLAPFPVRSRKNGWWARLWRGVLALFGAS